MISLFTGVILLIGLIIGTILTISDVNMFLDAPSLLLVIVGALLYSFAAGGDTIDRLDNFGFGAVRMGWIGFIIGIIFMASNNMIFSDEVFGPAFGVALLTVLYGYFFQIIINMIVYRMEINKFDDELNEEDEK